MSIETEIELTFLANDRILEKIKGIIPQKLIDIYFPNYGHATLRLRHNGNKYEITKKIPLKEGDSSIMSEMTIHLRQSEFEALSASGKRRIVKHRYTTKIDGYTAEIDIFQEKLSGLILIDFEFKSKEEKERFRTPKICLADVSQEKFIAGGIRFLSFRLK